VNELAFKDWRSVQEEVLRRIHAREWPPGALIPNEADLAQEFGCARSTVNRALRTLAENGVLDRRRKAGTRVAEAPSARAMLRITMLREEIEARGLRYGYQLLRKESARPPAAVRGAMQIGDPRRLLHLTALHLGDGRPYAIEDRWIDTTAVSGALSADFSEVSANEWLLRHAPYTHGEIAFSAARPEPWETEALACPADAALFAIDRLTWDGTAAITKVRLLFQPGYEMRTAL
jgi:GntR family histidine utilization transcriptional repressor